MKRKKEDDIRKEILGFAIDSFMCFYGKEEDYEIHKFYSFDILPVLPAQASLTGQSRNICSISKKMIVAIKDAKTRETIWNKDFDKGENTMYITTERKITHIIDSKRGKGWDGFPCTVCGKWVRPQNITTEKPKNCRLCKQCAKKENECAAE